jgi:hypothetical protein
VAELGRFPADSAHGAACVTGSFLALIAKHTHVFTPL